MLKIRFYNCLTSEPLYYEFTGTIVEWLSSQNFTKEEILDLRFFNEQLLGDEFDRGTSEFFEICEGEVCAVFDSVIPKDPFTIYAIIIVTVIVITVSLVPSPQPIGSDTQQSATNRLGETNNEPRINQRIDDIFGTVTKHTPQLWQVPYRIGVDNQETEVLFLCIGRGKYQMSESELFDGDTRILDIPNAQFSKYEPNTYPSNGQPSLQVGAEINEKLGIYRQSNDLNPSELLPPNDRENSEIEWSLTGQGLNGLLTAMSIPDELDFEELYQVGSYVTLDGLFYYERGEDVTLYTELDQGAGEGGQGNGTNQVNVQTYENLVDLGEDKSLKYLVTSVTFNSITVEIPVSATQPVKDAWALMVDFEPTDYFYLAFNLSHTFFHTLFDLSNTNYYEDFERQIPVFSEFIPYSRLIGVEFSGLIGPLTVPVGSTEVIINLSSNNGFYKLKSNDEYRIAATVEVVLYELDILGEPTGNTFTTDKNYVSNESARVSVFQTVRVVSPFTRFSVSVERITDRDKRDGVSNVDVITWSDLYSFEPVDNLDFGDVTVAHVVIPSNSASRLVKSRRQNVNLTRLITEYKGDGVFGETEAFATDDFSQILIHTSLDKKIGRLQLKNINADGFLSLSEQVTNYFGSSTMTRFGYDFDDSNLTFQDIFIRICAVANCLPYVQNGVYDAFFERLQPTSSTQITCRNKVEGSETRETIFEREFDGVELTYRDEKTSVSETIYLPSDRSGLNPDRKDLAGCVTELQAYRYAARLYNKQKYHLFNVSFDVDEFGRNIIAGKRIDSPDSTRFTKRNDTEDGYRVFEGEVIEVDGLNVELSEPVVFTEGEDHYIVFTRENGDNSEPILCTALDEFTIRLQTIPLEPIYDGYSRDRTKYTLTSEQLRKSVALIPQTIEFKLSDEGVETNTIGSVNYTDEYYKDDLGSMQ